MSKSFGDQGDALQTQSQVRLKGNEQQGDEVIDDGLADITQITGINGVIMAAQPGKIHLR